MNARSARILTDKSRLARLELDEAFHNDVIDAIVKHSEKSAIPKVVINIWMTASLRKRLIDAGYTVWLTTGSMPILSEKIHSSECIYMGSNTWTIGWADESLVNKEQL